MSVIWTESTVMPRNRAKFASLFLAVMAIMTAISGSPVWAQSASGVNPQRDCQTITTCRFTKGGSYRGCLSSYSCRTCRFVPARCSIGQARGKCQELQCGWGA